MSTTESPSAADLATEERHSLHVGIPRSILRRAKACAALEEREVADVVTAALGEYLDRHVVVEGTGNLVLDPRLSP